MCLYLFPTSQPEHEADLIFWVRTDDPASGLKNHLGEALDSWLSTTWAFTRLHVRK
ncbi:hypothetical protein [Hydrogenophaga sp.]|uniref:hypothetical protein n=1 Tax=Hydrogenophaga sp. TaxID=1904254 RepID=UPI0025C2BBDD|nr:hypothetical protein [Hydrogenophaga sp.]